MGRYEDLLASRREQLVAEELAGTPLFGDDFPRAAGIRDEQRGLGLEGSIEALYRRWRATPESQEVMQMLRAVALEWLGKGATQIGSRALWEEARRRLRRSADNKLQALACRELEEEVVALRGLFRHRERKAG